jgi:hypothetical protein
MKKRHKKDKDAHAAAAAATPLPVEQSLQVPAEGGSGDQQLPAPVEEPAADSREGDFDCCYAPHLNVQ